MLPTLGIDISKDSFHLELSINEKLRHRKFANRKEGFGELCAWLAKHKAIYVHACLEATGPYSEALAIYLHEQGHIVSVVNPVQIKAFGQSELLRNKDDRPDAGLIRRFCEKQRPPAWTPPPAHQRELQALTRHLENLLETRQQQLNRLEGPKPKGVIKSLRKLVAYLDAEIARTEKQIDDQIDSHPDLQQQCQLLESIPGIGRRTATKLLAEIEDISHYKSARQVAAYAGLTPKTIARAPGAAKPDYQRPVTPEFAKRSFCRRWSPSNIIRLCAPSVSAWLATAKTKWRSSARPCVNFFTSLSAF